LEKIFTPNKWFVLFCAVLVIMFAALQAVANMRLQEIAKAEGAHIFSWRWPATASSVGTVQTVDIIKKTENDAIVRVKAVQNIILENQSESKVPLKSEDISCSAVLTFYRVDKEWMLGKVQYE
jgi:hypothetical protein